MFREQNHPGHNRFLDLIAQNVISNSDYAGRNLKYWTDELDLPEYLRANKARWQHLFK